MRIGQTRAPRGTSPASTPRSAGSVSATSCAASTPSRMPRSRGASMRLGPLTTVPSRTSTAPGTRATRPAAVCAVARASSRSSPYTRSSIGWGVVVRSPITSSTSCPNSTWIPGAAAPMRSRSSSAISSELRCRFARRRST